MRKPSKKTLWNKADKLCGDWFRKSHCVARGTPSGRDSCECSGRIEWAHILSRSIGVLRWHPKNALPLCSAHHRYFTQRPLEFAAFLPERRDELREIERAIGPKPNPEYWIEWYKSRTDTFSTWDGEI